MPACKVCFTKYCAIGGAIFAWIKEGLTSFRFLEAYNKTPPFALASWYTLSVKPDKDYSRIGVSLWPQQIKRTDGRGKSPLNLPVRGGFLHSSY